MDLISTYTRAQAIADGVLIDVTSSALELGISCPVAITATLQAECVSVPAGVAGQDERGRLHDLLWIYRCAVLGRVPARWLDESTLVFELHVRNDDREGDPPLVAVKVQCGPGDNGMPVLTLMLPGED